MERDNSKKVYDFIKGNLINAIVIAIGLAYVFWGTVTIERTELSVITVLSRAGIGIVCGFVIKQALGENGFNKGYRSEIWLDSLEKYKNASNGAQNFIERVDNFYLYEEIRKKRIYRRTNLQAYQMRYSEFFDKDGYFIGSDEKVQKLTRKQRRMLNKCIRVKIYHLNLFSEYSNEIENDTRPEKTDKNQRGKMIRKNSFTAIFTAVAGAYFTATLGKFNLGAIIFATVQVLMWIAAGVIQLYSNYNYVTVEKTSKLSQKVEIITRFKRDCENGKYLNDPYEEMEEEASEEVLDKVQHFPVILAGSTS